MPHVSASDRPRDFSKQTLSVSVGWFLFGSTLENSETSSAPSADKSV